ncbi:MAG: hypothetical protein ACRC9X_08170 [Bacteroidales bacterium]
MSSRSYSGQIESAELMVSGLKKFAEEMKKRGIDAEFANQLKQHIEKAVELNNEQESMKADLKTKTEHLMNTLKLMHAQIAEATPIIKVTIPQSEWKSFGIDAKR